MIVENLSTLKINKLTQKKYNRELAANNIDENAFYLTPDVDVYITPEMFGGVCDGVTDDTEAILAACATGKMVVANNCVISDCCIENATIICNDVVVKGIITVRNVDISGKISVDGGGFVVDYTETSGRDNSNFHDLAVSIVNCDTFLTLQGTLYNVRFCNNTIIGSCNNHVISLISDTWLTYTIIADSFLGTCDQPIYIEANNDQRDAVCDIYIRNTYSQKYNPTKDCRFVSTNSLGRLFLDSSFMYDLVDGNDCQIYIRRNTGIRTRFNIVCTKTAADMTNDNFAKDSDGYSGQSLFSDIHEEAHIINSYKFPRQITSYNPFFEFAESSLTHGVANDIVVNENQFIGSMYKVGNYYKDNGYEYLVGGNYINNKLTTAHRNADNTDYEFNTYTAKEENAYVDTKEQLDAYGSGHPLFYQPQKKIITRYGSTYYDALGNVVGNTSSAEIKNVAISYKDLADKPNIETDEADDVFYIADKDGNVIATIDSQGLCSTKVNAKEIVLNTTNGEKKVLSTEDFTVSDGVLTFNFL